MTGSPPWLVENDRGDLEPRVLDEEPQQLAGDVAGAAEDGGADRLAVRSSPVRLLAAAPAVAAGLDVREHDVREAAPGSSARCAPAPGTASR